MRSQSLINAALTTENRYGSVVLIARWYPSLGWTIFGLVLASVFAYAAHPSGPLAPLVAQISSAWLRNWGWTLGFALLVLNTFIAFAIQLRARREPFAIATPDAVELPRTGDRVPRGEVYGTAAIAFGSPGTEKGSTDWHRDFVLVAGPSGGAMIRLLHIARPASALNGPLKAWSARAGLEYLGRFHAEKQSGRGKARAYNIAREMIREKLVAAGRLDGVLPCSESGA